MGCFTQHNAPANPCPVCGYDEKPIKHQLRLRTILNGKYLIGRALGEGGFGITYIGWDLNLNIRIAIKEFYPTGFVTRENSAYNTVHPMEGAKGEFFAKGREKFVNEARTLAKFRSLPGIVAVNEFFPENGTAYICMEYIEGQTLKGYLEKMGGKLPAGQVFDMMKPVMVALSEVHKSDMIHRDISPDNIMISKSCQMKLLDFGAARDFTNSGNKSLSVLLKPGFAPEEQYRSRGVQGPWTDIYALCATMYKCITGVTPVESISRVRTDELKPPSALGIDIEASREKALMMGMAPLQENRFQSVRAMYNAFYDSATVYIPEPVSGTTKAGQPEKPQPVAAAQPVAVAQPIIKPQQVVVAQPPNLAGAPASVKPPQSRPVRRAGKSTPLFNLGKLKGNYIAIAAIAGVCLLVISIIVLILS
jgi:serine/threonine protein kinase